jgi:hypothetical protein
MCGIETMMSASEAQVNEAPESRALVAVGASQPRQTPTLPRQAPALARRAAPFLAQLIATRAQAPQTRIHRRAEPAEAIARYRATAQIVK